MRIIDFNAEGALAAALRALWCGLFRHAWWIMRVVPSDTEEEEEEEEEDTNNLEVVEILDGTEVGTDDELDGEDDAIAEENGAQYDSALNLEQEPATIEETRCLLRIFEKVGVQNFAVRAAESGTQCWRTIFNRRMSTVETAREFAFSSKWTPEARELFNCAHSMRKISVFSLAEVQIIRDGSQRCMLCGTKCPGSRAVYALVGNATANTTCLPVHARRTRAKNKPKPVPGSGYSAKAWCRASIDNLHTLHKEYVDGYDKLVQDEETSDKPFDAFLGYFVVGDRCSQYVEASFILQNMPVSQAHYAEQILTSRAESETPVGREDFPSASEHLAIEWLSELEICMDVIRNNKNRLLAECHIPIDHRVWEAVDGWLYNKAGECLEDDTTRVRGFEPRKIKDLANDHSAPEDDVNRQWRNALLAVAGARGRERLRQWKETLAGKPLCDDADGCSELGEEDEQQQEEEMEQPKRKRARRVQGATVATSRRVTRRAAAIANVRTANAQQPEEPVEDQPEPHLEEAPEELMQPGLKEELMDLSKRILAAGNRMIEAEIDTEHVRSVLNCATTLLDARRHVS